MFPSQQKQKRRNKAEKIRDTLNKRKMQDDQKNFSRQGPDQRELMDPAPQFFGGTLSAIKDLVLPLNPNWHIVASKMKC